MESKESVKYRPRMHSIAEILSKVKGKKASMAKTVNEDYNRQWSIRGVDPWPLGGT
jgi:hypothetical protein